MSMSQHDDVNNREIEEFLKRWDSLIEQAGAAQQREVVERLRERLGYPDRQSFGFSQWRGSVDLALTQIFKQLKWVRSALWVLLIATNLLWLFSWLMWADAKPSLAVRLGIARDVAQELIQSEEAATAEGIPGSRPENPEIPEVESPGDFGRIYAPGTIYVKTQGPHGMSYGHYAIDYAARAGAPLVSPINGVVTANYIDGYGNPTLIIENQKFKVTLLHMDTITVDVNESVAMGDSIGTEGNKGYTMSRGQMCGTGSSCGYHIHLNVFDKEVGQNVDPSIWLDRYATGR